MVDLRTMSGPFDLDQPSVGERIQIPLDLGALRRRLHPHRADRDDRAGSTPTTEFESRPTTDRVSYYIGSVESGGVELSFEQIDRIRKHVVRGRHLGPPEVTEHAGGE